LKSLDSDERIQGNPRKSNPPERGFRGETATIQENQKAIGPTPALRGALAGKRFDEALDPGVAALLL